MSEVLLSSEAFVKEVSNMSDNVSAKYILPSLREAQEQGLKGILGDALLSRLKELVKTKTIGLPAHEMYKALLDRCQYYLAYKCINEVLYKVSYKVGNFGVSKSTDENLQVATKEEIDNQRYYYQAKADAYCFELQGWILDNKSSFPELTECHCNRIKSTLYSAATCGIFLGGERGKRR